MFHRSTLKSESSIASNAIVVAGQSYVDTEAGFLLNSDDSTPNNKVK